MKLPTMNMDAMKADMEKRLAEARAARARENAWNAENLLDAENIRNLTRGPARFNFLSLPAWLAVAEASGTPFIPATEIGSLARADFEDAINGVDNPNVHAFLALGTQVSENEMVRFTQCGPGSLKSDLSEGKGVSRGILPHYETGAPQIDMFDPRTYETFISLGESHLRAFKRPIIKAMTHKDTWETMDYKTGQMKPLEGEWPVEFRVFVREGQVTGVSNYYPQMTLPDAYLVEARDVAQVAQRMVDWMHTHRLGVGNGEMCADTGADEPERRAEWVPDHWGAQDFTLDFLVKTNGDAVFLEAGPGGFRAAAPCCFETGPFGKEHMLTGVKLGLESDVHPL